MEHSNNGSLTTKSHKSRKTTATVDADPTVRPEMALDGIPPAGLAPATPLTPNSDAPLVLAPTDQDVAAPKKQFWWRAPDSKSRKICEKIVIMRAAGHADKAIAKKLGTTEANVAQTVYLGRKNGWIDKNSGEMIDLELELALNIDRKVVRNISASLDGQMTNWQTHEMTIAAAKGRGMFKTHDPAKNETAMPSVVAIQVIMPPIGAADQPELREDQVGGIPAYMDAEISDVGTPSTETLHTPTGPREALQIVGK